MAWMNIRWNFRSPRLLTTAAVFASAAGVVSQGRPSDIDRRLERPIAQRSLNNSTSAVQTSFVFPTAGAIDFDYFVDSEPGYDFLRIYLDGVLQNQWSGLGVAGHKSIAVGSGLHSFKVEYLKDVSLSYGLDTAWVDNVLVSAGAQTLERNTFNIRSPLPASWTGSGVSGGFALTRPAVTRVLQRPLGQAFAGNQTPTASSISRTFTWPSATNNFIAFDYELDSEPGWDYLRVYVDGALQFQTSGRAIASKALNVGGAGAHTVKFEYYKDGSVDVGRDTAIVDRVVATSNGQRFEWHDFDGLSRGSTPQTWTSSGAAGGWIVSEAPPARAFVKPTPSGPAPVCDGAIAFQNEYAEATVLPLPDLGSVRGRTGTAVLRAMESEYAFHAALRVHSATLAAGDESGTITVLFDDRRLDTLLGIGSCNTRHLPGPEDRKLEILYSAAAGARTATTSTVQYVGDCAGGWSTANAADSWPVTVAVAEPAGDPGFLHVEIRVVLKRAAESLSNAFTEKKFGLALSHANATGAISREDLPTSGAPFASDDVTGWLTIDLLEPAFDDRDGRVEAVPVAGQSCFLY
jgi:hypothetical protein